MYSLVFSDLYTARLYSMLSRAQVTADFYKYPRTPLHYYPCTAITSQLRTILISAWGIWSPRIKHQNSSANVRIPWLQIRTYPTLESVGSETRTRDIPVRHFTQCAVDGVRARVRGDKVLTKPSILEELSELISDLPLSHLSAITNANHDAFNLTKTRPLATNENCIKRTTKLWSRRAGHFWQRSHVNDNGADHRWSIFITSSSSLLRCPLNGRKIPRSI